MSNGSDAWLQDALIDGLQLLVSLRLRDAPAPDSITVTLDAWLLVFRSRPMRWDEPTAPRRLRQAFLDVAATAERWPLPAHVLREFKPPPPPPALPAPPSFRPIDVREKLDALRAQFVEKTKTQPTNKRKRI